MSAILFATVAFETAVLLTMMCLYVRSATSLSRYRGIADAEKFKAQCEHKAKAALSESESLKAEAKVLNDHIAAQKTKVGQYQRLLGNLKSAAELQQRIRSDTARIQQLAAVMGKLQRASQVDEYLRAQEATIAENKSHLEEFDAAIGEARDTLVYMPTDQFHAGQSVESPR
jgi:chromosome segregation ATPase